MYATGTWNGQRAISAVVAAMIVALSGLAIERGHVSTSKAGVVGVSSLAPTDVMLGVTELPEVVVRATRLATNPRQPSW
jgi:hypothetical protein